MKQLDNLEPVLTVPLLGLEVLKSTDKEYLVLRGLSAGALADFLEPAGHDHHWPDIATMENNIELDCRISSLERMLEDIRSLVGLGPY